MLEGIETAERVGFGPIKINCVVQKGVNDHTLLDLARHFKGTGHIVRFIEFMDVGTKNAWDLEQVLPAAEIVAMIDACCRSSRSDANYQGRGRKALALPGRLGRDRHSSRPSRSPFCGDCTRARLTTDGQLVTCLFASRGTDLRASLRGGASDEELRGLLAGIWQGRSDRYSEERAAILRGDQADEGRSERVEMYQIGG